MANERNTENAVRDIMRELGYYNQEEQGSLAIEEQGTENLTIKDLLKSASKSGSGSGKPEFIIYSEEFKDFIIVIECKKDKNFHVSPKMDKAKDFAVDGARHYALHLSKNKKLNVIFIGISGISKSSLEISTFLLVKKSSKHKELVDRKGKPVKKIIPFKDYIDYALFDPEIEKVKREELINFSKRCHDYMRDTAALDVTEKPLIISGALLALKDKAFSRNYTEYNQEKELAEEFVTAIRRVIRNTEMPESKKDEMLNPYSFIKGHVELNKEIEGTKQTPLYVLINDIKEHITPFINVYTDYDVIWQFYGEFLRYTGGDKKGLGIVLTPRHITELFCDLAQLTSKSVVLDICGGTGGFLISAMNTMISKANSENEKENIRNNGLLGVEQMERMFALLASNMILRGDGKANLYQSNCFEKHVINKIKDKATVGMINPPYAQKRKNSHELDFVKHLLDLLKPKGIGIAIVPMSCAIKSHPMKNEILKSHRLDAVLSLPKDLFHGIAGTITCIMIFTAHIPHDENPRHKTWFGLCKDDGFIKTKTQGRIDSGKWNDIKEQWLSAYESKKEIGNFSVLKKVSHEDEWCAEAYLKTDYSDIKKDHFIKKIKEHLAFKFLQGFVKEISGKPFNNKEISLAQKDFKLFPIIYDKKTSLGLFNMTVGTDKAKVLQVLEESKNKNDVVYEVSNTALNNGVNTYYPNKKNNNLNTITLATRGNDFKSFYHDYDIIPIVRVINLKSINFKLNIYIALFLCTVFEKNSYKFSYGRVLNGKNILKENVSIPVDNKGNPDWKFMEDFIKSLPYSKNL